MDVIEKRGRELKEKCNNDKLFKEIVEFSKIEVFYKMIKVVKSSENINLNTVSVRYLINLLNGCLKRCLLLYGKKNRKLIKLILDSEQD